MLVIFLTALIKYPNKSNLGRKCLSGISAWKSSPLQCGSHDDRIWSDCTYSQEAESDGCSNSACLLCLLKTPFILFLGNWLHANIVYWSYPPHCPPTTPRHLQYVLLETSCSLPPPPASLSLSLSPISAACCNADCSWLGPGNQGYSEFVSIMAMLCLEDNVLWHCSLSGDSYIFFLPSLLWCFPNLRGHFFLFMGLRTQAQEWCCFSLG